MAMLIASGLASGLWQFFGASFNFMAGIGFAALALGLLALHQRCLPRLICHPGLDPGFRKFFSSHGIPLRHILQERLVLLHEGKQQSGQGGINVVTGTDLLAFVDKQRQPVQQAVF